MASLRWQLVHHRRLLMLVLLPVLAVQFLLVAIRVTTGVPIAEFTRDPLGYTDLPVYKGSVSNLGVLIWKASAAICLFTFVLVRFRRTILHTNFLFLALALGGFGVSILADAIANRVTIPAYFLIEDGGSCSG